MKKSTIIFFLCFIFLPLITNAAQKSLVTIEGEIGDSAPASRIYSINGRAFHLQEDTVVEDKEGKTLSFDVLKGGVQVRLIGVKETDGSKEVLKSIKIIVIGK